MPCGKFEVMWIVYIIKCALILNCIWALTIYK